MQPTPDVKPVSRSFGSWTLRVILGVAGLLGACDSREELPVARNLVFISVDTLRADRLGCYGYGRDTTPGLDRFARQGMLFQQATAPSPWTLPSHASMFTGLSPKRHGAKGFKGKLTKQCMTLAEHLQERGFQTHAIVSSSILTGGGLQRGFDSLVEVDKGGLKPSAVTTECIAKLDQIDLGKRFLLLAHYIDPHTDYGSLEPFHSRFVEPYEGRATGIGQQLYRAVSGDLEFNAEDVQHLSNLYDGGVAQVDEQVAELFAHIKALGIWDQTLVLVTSDHGEEFLDHGGLMHGFNHHEEMIRVPLILQGPGIPKGQTSRVPVSLMDLLPTCLLALGLPNPQELEGVALQPLWETPEQERAGRSFFYEADWDAPRPGQQSLSSGSDRALRVGRYKLHLNLKTRAQSLFDLESDPLERVVLVLINPQIAKALEHELLRYLGESETGLEAALSAKELEELAGLGYAATDDEQQDVELPGASPAEEGD